ncbi:MAG: DMT family transporter [Lentisphaeria bacterium]|nr:DMT family transporter [Lentisphaeria bacterium]
MNKKFIGYFTAVAAAVTFGLNPLFGLKLYANNLSSPTVLFYRFLMAAFFLAILIIFQKKSFIVPKRHYLMLIVLALCLAGTSLGLFCSFQKMDASIASTLLFTYPVLVAVIMAVFFKEKVTFQIVLSILLSLAGVAVLCKTSDGAIINLAGLALALFSAFAYAVYIVIVKKSKLHELEPETMTFYTMLLSLPCFILTPGFEFAIPLKSEVLLNLAGLAFFPGFLSLYMTAVGLKYIGATQTAILGALEPLTAVCIGVIVFHESFTFRLALGLVLILTSVTIVILSGRKTEDTL